MSEQRNEQSERTNEGMETNDRVEYEAQTRHPDRAKLEMSGEREKKERMLSPSRQDKKEEETQKL